MIWEELLIKQFRIWINTYSSTDNTLHRSGRAIERIKILLQIEKACRIRDKGSFTPKFFVDDAVNQTDFSNRSGILTIEQFTSNFIAPKSQKI